MSLSIPDFLSTTVHLVFYLQRLPIFLPSQAKSNAGGDGTQVSALKVYCIIIVYNNNLLLVLLWLHKMSLLYLKERVLTARVYLIPDNGHTHTHSLLCIVCF